MRRNGAFTLIEIMLAVIIASLMLLIAVPSIKGVLTEQRMKESFEKFDTIVRLAQSRSLTEQRAYLLVWQKTLTGLSSTVLILRPDEPLTPGEEAGISRIQCAEKESYDIELPAAIVPGAQKAWMFWPNGTCEPANIFYKGPLGGWIARYDPLTIQPDYSQQ